MTVSDIRIQNGSGEIISLGAREDDYVLDSADWDVAKVSTGTIFYFPTDDSERALYQEWQPRSVSILGWVIGASEADIETKSRRLDAFIGLQNEIKILYNGFHLTFYAVKNVKFANTERENNEVLRKFQIDGICLDPMWHDDSVVENRNFHEVPMFFFPLWFTPDMTDDPRVVFSQQYSNAGEGNDQFSMPMAHFPLILNEDIPSMVFGQLYRSTYSIINYDGVLSSGIVFTIISTDIIRSLAIQMEHNGTTQTFTLTGEYPANTEIVIDTREGFHTVTVGGRVVDRWDNATESPMFHFPLTFNENDPTIFGEIFRPRHVAEGSTWLRLRPGLSIFTYFYNSDGELDVFVDTKQKSLFEVQT